MNIFYLDRDPHKAATFHGDKHVIKMILESAQMLSTAHRILDGTQTIEKHNNRKRSRYTLSDELEGVLYKPTHINHPCSVWVRESAQNYHYLYSLFFSLCKEYTFRYGKVHKSESLKDHLYLLPKSINHGALTKPALAMPDDYKLDCPIASYKNYYIKEKYANGIAQWNKTRKKPEWII